MAVRGEAGFAVMVVLVLASLITAVAAGWLLATSTDVQIAAAFREEALLRAAADAGAQLVGQELVTVPDWSLALSGTVQSSVFADGPPSGFREVGDGTRVNLDVVRSLIECGRLTPCSDTDRTTVTALRPWGPDNPRWRPFAYAPVAVLMPAHPSAPGYVIVLVADDPSETDGDPDRDGAVGEPGAGLVRVRSEAFGPGGGHRSVEALFARPDPAAPGLRLLAWREES